MNSFTTGRFWRAFEQLDEQTQNRARSAYRLFEQNPYHPGLHFKKVHPTRPIYSVRISLNYRALGIRDDDGIVWFWIGSHEDYEMLLKRL